MSHHFIKHQSMYLLIWSWDRTLRSGSCTLPLLRPGQSNYYCSFSVSLVSPVQLTSSRGVCTSGLCTQHEQWDLLRVMDGYTSSTRVDQTRLDSIFLWTVWMCVDAKLYSRNIEDHDLGKISVIYIYRQSRQPSRRYLIICFDNVSAMMMQYRYSFPFHVPLVRIWGARLQTALVHLPLFCILHLSLLWVWFIAAVAERP